MNCSSDTWIQNVFKLAVSANESFVHFPNGKVTPLENLKTL